MRTGYQSFDGLDRDITPPLPPVQMPFYLCRGVDYYFLSIFGVWFQESKPICEKLKSAMTDSSMLELIQALPTSGARAAADFVLDGHQYLAIPQLAEDIPGEPAGMNLGNSDTDLILYRLNDLSQFEEYQRLPVPGGEDAEFFTIAGKHFLATASLRSGKGPYNMLDVSSTIFVWRDDKFVPHQSIPTFAAKQWRYFFAAGRHFLALAQGVSIPGLEPKISPESTIFEWDEATALFKPFQTVPSAWGYNWLHFTLSGQDFLAYADHKMPSIVLRLENGKFEPFYTFQHDRPLHGRAFCLVETKEDVLLLFANISGESLVYYWDGSSFQIRQRLKGAGGREFTLIRNGEDVYVAQIRFITGTREAPNTALESVIYRVEDGYLEEIKKFPTLGGTDVSSITVKGETWIIVTESLTKEQRFRVDSQVYRFKFPAITRNKIQGSATWQSPEFLGLFETYTASSDSLGTKLGLTMSETTASYPLLAATSNSMILFPGGGRDPSFISFRLSNRGFKELAAVSHLAPALASLVQIYAADPSGVTWRSEAKRLLAATEKAGSANSIELWRDKIRVEAYRGREAAIAAMVEYSCSITVKYLQAVLEDPQKLSPGFLQREYLEATGDALGATVPMNAVMIATFFLVGMDIAYRMRIWLGDQHIDWSKAMVVIVGKQGRETAGVTLTTNSVAQIIFQSSNLELPSDRLYIAPHGPDVTVTGSETVEFIRKYEAPMRLLWNRNRAMCELGLTMFSGYPAYKPLSQRPEITSMVKEVSEMPLIHGPDDWMSMTTRLRVVLEDVRQLLSGCVTDYAAEQLRIKNNHPAAVVVPGLDHFDYPNAPTPAIYPTRGVGDRPVLKIGSAEVEPEFNFPGKKCTNGTAELAFWEEGDGEETIIWIHGLPLASQSWGAQRKYFSTKYRNIYIDLRGYGESSKLPEGVEDVTQLYCDDLEFLMRHLNISQAHIVGFASAGHVALRFAAQNSQLVKKLIVINGSPCFRKAKDWPYGFSDEAISSFVSAADKNGIEGITNMVLDPSVVFRDLPHEDAEKVVDWFRQMSFKAGVKTLLGFFNHISRDDDRRYLSSIKASTLLVTGSLGQEVPSESVLFTRETIPKAFLVEIPDADHFLFITRPDVFNQLVDGFLSRN